ncbi:MAG TPA: arginine repressor [Candidatus Dormibacteraeota bacterium]|nr:arginine repressor [Candidatus Dormibacteraeota bacterium]
MKEERQRAILELVKERPVQTQQDLVRALTDRGISATQATVSRDVQELGLVRTGSGYRIGTPVSVASELVLSIRQVQFLAVIRTPPGTANLVARAIDESELDGVAGTVAGDDTIIVVLEDGDAGDNLRRFLGAES